MTGAGRDRTAGCHASCAGRKLETGDLVAICRCSTGIIGHLIGYDRPAVVGGKPTLMQCKILKTACEAQEAALALIEPGVTANTLYEAAMKVIKESGLVYEELHRVGRAVGYSGADGDDISEVSELVLKLGMVLTIEPGLYVPGRVFRYDPLILRIQEYNHLALAQCTP